MNQISEAELTNRINTFMARKMEQFPELEKKRRHVSKVSQSRYDIQNPTFLEKMNEFWAQRVHA